MKFSRKIDGNIVLVAIKENLDFQSIRDFQELLESLHKENLLKVIFDFTGTEFIDSSSIAALIGALLKTRKKGGDFRIISPGGYLNDLFKIIKLEEIIRIFPDEPTAISSFSESKV